MIHNHSSEKGQAIVLLAISIVVLLGFTALALDGGMVFSERRRDQNAADAAALAGALQKANSKSDSTAILAAKNSVTSNGYAANQMSVSIDNNYQDYSGHYILVKTVITTTTPTNFAHLIYGKPLVNVVTATARARLSQPVMPGTAIVAMGRCSTNGSDLIGVTGGGHAGGVITFLGGMFINNKEDSSDACAISPPNSSGTLGIDASGYSIYSVGSYDYSGVDNIKSPVVPGINGGEPVTDPWILSKPDEPTCTSNGSTYTPAGDQKHYRPGYYGGSGQPDLGGGVLDAGIYCITGDIGGNYSIDATAGVVLYFISGAPRFTGNGDFRVTAPDSSTCVGNEPDTSASCTFAGFAIYLARSNTSTITLTGNGVYKIIGMVYAVNGGMVAKGGGTTGCDDSSDASSPDSSSCDWVVEGQVIAGQVQGDGNGGFSVYYNAGVLPRLPTMVSLQK